MTCTRCTCPRCSPELPKRLAWRLPRFTLPTELPSTDELDVARIAMRHAIPNSPELVEKMLAQLDINVAKFRELGADDLADAAIAGVFITLDTDTPPDEHTAARLAGAS